VPDDLDDALVVHKEPAGFVALDAQDSHQLAVWSPGAVELSHHGAEVLYAPR
jgi:hypothetical protein